MAESRAPRREIRVSETMVAIRIESTSPVDRTRVESRPRSQLVRAIDGLAAKLLAGEIGPRSVLLPDTFPLAVSLTAGDRSAHFVALSLTKSVLGNYPWMQRQCLEGDRSELAEQLRVRVFRAGDYALLTMPALIVQRRQAEAIVAAMLSRLGEDGRVVLRQPWGTTNGCDAPGVPLAGFEAGRHPLQYVETVKWIPDANGTTVQHAETDKLVELLVGSKTDRVHALTALWPLTTAPLTEGFVRDPRMPLFFAPQTEADNALVAVMNLKRRGKRVSAVSGRLAHAVLRAVRSACTAWSKVHIIEVLMKQFAGRREYTLATFGSGATSCEGSDHMEGYVHFELALGEASAVCATCGHRTRKPIHDADAVIVLFPSEPCAEAACSTGTYAERRRRAVSAEIEARQLALEELRANYVRAASAGGACAIPWGLR